MKPHSIVAEATVSETKNHSLKTCQLDFRHLLEPLVALDNPVRLCFACPDLPPAGVGAAPSFVNLSGRVLKQYESIQFIAVRTLFYEILNLIVSDAHNTTTRLPGKPETESGVHVEI